MDMDKYHQPADYKSSLKYKRVDDFSQKKYLPRKILVQILSPFERIHFSPLLS